MNDNAGGDMKHEDNSFATKLGVIFSVVVLLVVGAACLYVIWQFIKLFIYWD